jgi:hypothetical protein
MKSACALLVVLLCLTGLGYGQTPAASPTAGAALPALIATPVTFHSDFLDLSFTYPGSLVAEKLPSPEEQHAATARKQPTDEKPEYKKLDQCTDRALLARRKDEPATPGGSVTVQGAFYADKRAPVLTVNHAVTAEIMIARIGIECMPDEYRNQPDDVAAAMAATSAQGQDLKPIDQPIWYDVGKTRVHFAAAQSYSEEKQTGTTSGDKKERRWIASVAFVSNGNLVSMLFESNDVPFLNEMLHGKVTIGKQSAAPLFPAEIGAGTPLQPKP